MPNYCSCNLTLQGTVDQLDACLDAIRERTEPDIRVIDFARLVPIEQSATDATRQSLWGTKWNCCGGQILDNASVEHVEIEFSTASTPPLAWVATLVETFDELELVEFVWHELATDQAGYMQGEQGNVVFDERVDEHALDFLDEYLDLDTVRCSLCHRLALAETAHLHHKAWVGDTCCWDERLRSGDE